MMLIASSSKWTLAKTIIPICQKIKTQNAQIFGAISAITVALILINTIVGQVYAQGIIKFGNDGKPGVESIFFGDTKYVIPNSYLPGITPLHKAAYSDFTKEHGYAAFSLQLGLPDLTPGLPDRDSIEGRGWGHAMRVLVEYGFHFREPEDLLTANILNVKITKDDFVQMENGCKLYKGDVVFTEELYACQIKDHLLLVRCNTPSSVPSPGCRVMENFSENSTIIYNYGRNFIGRAIEIDQKLRALLASFAASDAKNAK